MVVFAPAVDTLVFNSRQSSSPSTTLSSWLSNDGVAEHDPSLTWYTQEEFLAMRKNALCEDSKAQGGRFLSGRTTAYLKEEQRRRRIARVVHAVLDEQRNTTAKDRTDRLAQVSSELSQTARDDARNRGKKESSLCSQDELRKITEELAAKSTSRASATKLTRKKSTGSTRMMVSSSTSSSSTSTRALVKRNSSFISRYHRRQGLWTAFRSVVSNRDAAAFPVLCLVLTLAAMQQPQTRSSK